MSVNAKSFTSLVEMTALPYSAGVKVMVLGAGA